MPKPEKSGWSYNYEAEPNGRNDGRYRLSASRPRAREEHLKSLGQPITLNSGRTAELPGPVICKDNLFSGPID